MTYDVVVIGGGPAGSSAAVHLSRAGRHVLLVEKDRHPRDKLCGEFLSTEVAGLCARLGMLDRMKDAGARAIHSLRFSGPGGRRFSAPLPGTAMGLSRRAFDHLLFDRAREAGAETLQGVSIRSVDGSLSTGFTVRSDVESFGARVVVGAYGRRSALDRRLGRSFLPRHSPLVAFKAHFEGSLPDSVIELHAFAGGYCGLLAVERGGINVCWIAHRNHVPRSTEDRTSELHRANPVLSDRLAGMRRLHDYLAVSQLSFRLKSVFANDVCMIGDAAGMIAPLCGDGMAMAMRSAELVAPEIIAFLDGRHSAAAFRRRYEQIWKSQFSQRMRTGRMLHALMTRPRIADAGVLLSSWMPVLPQAFILATRG